MRKKQSHTKGIILFLMICFIVGYFGYRFIENREIKINNDEVLEVFQQDQHSHYFYSKLNEKDQDTYRRLYYAFVDFKTSIPLEEKKVEKVSKIFQNVLDDHPEIYYVNSEYQYIDGKQFMFIPKFDMKQDKVKTTNRAVTEKTKEVLKTASQQNDDVDKAKVLYDYIVETVEYKEHSELDQKMTSALLDQQSVCAGYARAYQYLLHQVNIPCAYITGDTIIETEDKPGYDGHAWNMLEVNGDYYYSDPTWGDADDEDMEHTCYGYFLMNSTDMLKIYQPDGAYEKTSSDDDLYFESVDSYMKSYDENIISHAIQLGLKNKTRIAEIKCANQAVYNRVKKNLESSYLGYRLLTKNGCWSDQSLYYCIDELRVIELYY